MLYGNYCRFQEEAPQQSKWCCDGFESILEGLFGPRLLKDISLFEDCEPTGVSDWSFDENCLFCCLRREKVKEHLVALDQPKLKVGEEALSRQDQAKINRLEKQAEEFLNAVFQRKDSPRVTDPSIPLVAREIMHRMIRQFAAEYTSKTSTSQDSIVLTSTKDQSASKTPVLGASALNPVLSKLLMADQDSPLDLTVKKSNSESDNQDGVLDLSTKKSPCASNVSSSKSLGCSSSAILAKGNVKTPTQEAEPSTESQTSLDQFMAKLCRHHQIQFMSVLSYMRSEANPALEPSESSAHEGMAASSPAPVQQPTKNPEGPTGSRSTLQSRPPSSREPQTPNCESRGEGSRSTHEEALRLGTETSSAAPVNKLAPKSCCGGTCIKNWTIGAGPSSVGLCAADCNIKGSVEPLQKETVSRKEIGDSQLDQSSRQCAHISAVPQIEVVSPNSKESKAEGAVTARAQNESLRAFPVELLNLSKNLAKNPSSSPSSSRPSLDHEAIKSGPIQGGPQENTNATKRTIKDNLVLPADASTKDCWFVSKSHAAVRDTNGRLRLKAQSPSTKTARKSTRVSVLRARSSMSTVCQYVNEHDNQCDIVYISKPITECRFDAQRSLSSTKKTARKSTRGHLCNEEYWELQTVRTLARGSATDTKRANRPSLIPKPPASASPKQALTLPVSVPAIEVPVAAGAGENGGSKVQLKVVLRRGQSQELKENRDFRCPAGEGELVAEPSQSRRSQEADAPSSNASSPPVEPKKPGGETNASGAHGQSLEIQSAPALNVQTSGDIATRGALGAGSQLEPAACESCDPSSGRGSEPLEERWQAPGSPSRLVPSVKERDDTGHKSLTEGSLNNSEPSPNNQIEALSVPSLNNLGTGPVNNIRVDDIPSPEQCSGSSEVLNGHVVMGDIPGSIAGDWRAGGFCESVENAKEVMAEKSLAEKEESNGSGQTLSFPTVAEAIACSLTPKKEPCPEIASDCKEERSGNDPGGPTLEPKGPCERTDGIKCKMPAAHPYLEERSLDDVDKNVAANEREEGNSTGRSPKSEKNTSPQKEKTLSPEKVKHRKKLELASSDRCLRSQQSQPQPMAGPSGVKQEPVVCAEGLLVPCLDVKLLRSPGERGYKREVCVNRAASVQFPADCFNKTLLQSIIDPESRVDESLATTSVKDTGKTRKLAAKQASKGLPAESSADEEPMDDGFVCERAHVGQGRMLEVYVDTGSPEERKVSFSSDKVETDQGTESSDDSADDPSPATHRQSSLGKAGVHKESQKWARGGLAKRSAGFGSPHQANKGMAAKMSPGDKKAIGSRDLRCPNVSITEPEMIVLEADDERLNINLSTEVIREPEDSEPVDLNDSDAPEVSRPKFLDWCSEDENQELITTLNAKYENIHKAWIQIEKEGSVMQKAKSKSDWLKEIWKSKKRARKARGLYGHKISPVQKLFVANFDFTNICKWFMETTETRSLVIVKNVTARNPVETLKAKSFLQKSSAAGLFPSPQAERLRKHLKKFAVASPARNNWRTRALMDSVQRGGAPTGADQRQDFLPDIRGGLVPRNLFLPDADGSLGGVKAAQPAKHLGMKKPLSAWILRKYSNMREKLRAQHQSQHGKEQAAKRHPAKHRSVCMNPLVSPKLTSQTQLDSRGVPPPSTPPRPQENKGKKKPPREAPAKELRAGRSKSCKSEAGPTPLPSSKSTSRQLPANRKPRAEGGAAKPLGPKKPARGGKAGALPPNLSRKGAKKRFSGAPLKTIQKGKSRPQNRDGAKGRKVKPKTKAGSGKERRAKPTKRTRPSPAVAAQARAKRREKTGAQRKNKAVAPAKAAAPTRTPAKAAAPAKGVCKTEAAHKRKRKLNEKSQPVPNKRRRTDAK